MTSIVINELNEPEVIKPDETGDCHHWGQWTVYQTN